MGCLHFILQGIVASELPCASKSNTDFVFLSDRLSPPYKSSNMMQKNQRSNYLFKSFLYVCVYTQ
uniref:Uncharacterized protein n=1 Tax=Octopus bimaculoides TaxID=37653 RepID=A0A0L8IGH6_OCTBM